MTPYVRRSPRGPFMVLGIVRENDTAALENALKFLNSDHQIFAQESGLEWTAVVMSLNEFMTEDLNLRTLFDQPNLRAQMIAEHFRVIGTLSQIASVLPVQFGTVANLQCGVHRLLLREANLFKRYFEGFQGRQEYLIDARRFGPAKIANDRMSAMPHRIHAERDVLKSNEVAELCHKALTKDLIWHQDLKAMGEEKHTALSAASLASVASVDFKPDLIFSVVCLMDTDERDELETRLLQLGSMAGIAGLTLELSAPQPVYRYVEYMKNAALGVPQDGTKRPAGSKRA